MWFKTSPQGSNQLKIGYAGGNNKILCFINWAKSILVSSYYAVLWYSVKLKQNKKKTCLIHYDNYISVAISVRWTTKNMHSSSSSRCIISLMFGASIFLMREGKTLMKKNWDLKEVKQEVYNNSKKTYGT